MNHEAAVSNAKDIAATAVLAAIRTGVSEAI